MTEGTCVCCEKDVPVLNLPICWDCVSRTSRVRSLLKEIAELKQEINRLKHRRKKAHAP